MNPKARLWSGFFVFCSPNPSLTKSKNKPMNPVFAQIKILNNWDATNARMGLQSPENIRKINLNIRVDTGALLLSINKSIQEMLGLPFIEYRTAELANGQKTQLPVVGPVEIRYQDRRSTGNAYVLPGDSEPLLGVLPLEEMDLWINPNRNILTPIHPEGWITRLS